MAISFDSIGQVCVTANLDGEITVGSPVTFTAPATVSPCAEGGKIHGVAASCHGDVAAVTVRGFVTLPYTGTAPAVGSTAITGAANGTVKTGGTVTYLVTDVDTVNKTVTFLL